MFSLPQSPPVPSTQDVFSSLEASSFCSLPPSTINSLKPCETQGSLPQTWPKLELPTLIGMIPPTPPPPEQRQRQGAAPRGDFPAGCRLYHLHTPEGLVAWAGCSGLSRIWGLGVGGVATHMAVGSRYCLPSLGLPECQGVAAASPAGVWTMSGVLAEEHKWTKRMVSPPGGDSGARLSYPGSAPVWVLRGMEKRGWRDSAPAPPLGGGTWHILNRSNWEACLPLPPSVPLPCHLGGSFPTPAWNNLRNAFQLMNNSD